MSEPDHFPELAEKLQSIRERIRQRMERTAPSLAEMRFPSLDPLKKSQAAARHLATAIGAVNPRPPGIANEMIQSAKRALARLIAWLVRPQWEFNQNVAEALEKIIEALEVTNRNLTIMREFGADLDALGEQVTQQRWAYEGALMRQSEAVEELRQRMVMQAKAQATRLEAGGIPVAASGRPAPPPTVDYIRLENQFRGTEEEIKKRQSFYTPFFQGRKNVLDIACGRGEFLELMRDAGVPARGVDLDADMVGCCLEKGLEVIQGDVFAHLATTPAGSLDGIFSAQFVEHLEPADYLRLIAECAAKLAPGGVLAIETQNPECLAIFSQSFFIDPTHVRPIPPAQLRFAYAEAGLERITTHSLSPAAAILPVLPQLPAGAAEPEALRAFNAAVARFNETFFGGMDYAVIGHRPRPAG